MPEIETNGLEVLETREWVDSLDYVLSKGGPERAGRLLQQLSLHARREAGVNLPFSATTPYQNTIASRHSWILCLRVAFCVPDSDGTAGSSIRG